ncbi:Chromodomain Y-like protein 2 [Holothuria leucospilota]|uniref:Chromodomain Y-like protein 2 n=1 Tax=Holothuria leucospilota TaxID=206669 RepID=A0A9Q1CQI7_HOLLE|nr:Chromodomain Y-like protein 2 [Holothuria leucospilota]
MVARPFLKGYLPRWTEELVTVAQRLPRLPVVYRLKYCEGEWLEGTFYEAELQKVTKDGSDVYRVERIVRTRKTKDGKTEYFVKWKGYPSKFNTWVSNLIKL